MRGEIEIISWMQSFFGNLCDGEWERQYGIKISTVGNPGWNVKIDVSESIFEDIKFDKIRELRTEDDWIIIDVKDGIVFGSGGVGNLYEILYKMRNIFENQVF